MKIIGRTVFYLIFRDIFIFHTYFSIRQDWQNANEFLNRHTKIFIFDCENVQKCIFHLPEWLTVDSFSHIRRIQEGID